jgi:hypothetical protein
MLRSEAAPRFDLDDPAQAAGMLQHLAEHGYAVVASVASEEDIRAAKESFWNFQCSDPGISRHDPATWEGPGWVGSADSGICSGKGFNHSDFMWNARLLPKVKQAFGLIWETDELIVSFDAGNVFRPWTYNPHWLTKGKHNPITLQPNNPILDTDLCITLIELYLTLTRPRLTVFTNPSYPLYHPFYNPTLPYITLYYPILP